MLATNKLGFWTIKIIRNYNKEKKKKKVCVRNTREKPARLLQKTVMPHVSDSSQKRLGANITADTVCLDCQKNGNESLYQRAL